MIRTSRSFTLFGSVLFQRGGGRVSCPESGGVWSSGYLPGTGGEGVCLVRGRGDLPGHGGVVWSRWGLVVGGVHLPGP